MAMVGFSFTKINAERKNAVAQAINIESNAAVSNITEVPGIDAKKTVLKFDFTFIVKYEPGAGKIELSGEAIELYDKDFGAKVMDYWNKEKKIHAEIMPELFNGILARSNVEAIVVSRDLGLPTPLQMPRVDVVPKGAKAEGKSDAKPEKAKK